MTAGPSSLSLFLGAALFAGARSAPASNLIAIVNHARLETCSSGPRAALRDSPMLRAAAVRMAGGASLDAGLRAAGYIAVQSSAVHLSGNAGDAQMAQVLAAHECATLAAPGFTEAGAVMNREDLWVVLAAPAPMPDRDTASVRDRILHVMNDARGRGRRCGGKLEPPVPPLRPNQNLSDAALAHARDMARYSEFDHRGHDGSTPAQRAARAGWRMSSLIGENIAAGPMTADEVARGWLASPAHCENIMDARFQTVGIAFAVNIDSQELMYWAEEFAAADAQDTGGIDTRSSAGRN